MKNKKILYLITRSHFGGAQRYVLELATVFKEDNKVLVATGSQGPLVQKLENEGVQTTSLDKLGRNINILKEIAVFFQFLKLINHFKPDILHVNSSKAGGLGALAGRILGVKNIIFTAHGLPYFEKRSLISRVLILFFTWLTIGLSHKTIVVSKHDFESATLLPLFGKKIYYIPIGIKEFNLDKNKSSERLSGLVDNVLGKTLILSIGELVENKGYIWAIEALKDALENENLVWVIAGSGKQEKEISEKIDILGLKGNIRLLGYVENARELLPASDILLVPSLKEGLPYVLLEAGISGTAVCASEVGGIPDLIEDGKSGHTFKVGDKKELIKSVKKTLSNKETFGQNLKNKVKKNFSFKRMLEETARIY